MFELCFIEGVEPGIEKAAWKPWLISSEYTCRLVGADLGCSEMISRQLDSLFRLGIHSWEATDFGGCSCLKSGCLTGEDGLSVVCSWFFLIVLPQTKSC